MSNQREHDVDRPSGGAKEEVPARGGVRVLRHPWPGAERAEAERLVRQALRGGAVMTYPTETAYALGGNALLPAVTGAVFRLKDRPRDKALLLLIDGTRGVEPWARDVHPAARALMERCWPGPLTLVFRAGAGLPAHLADARGTVALRWSPHPVVAGLLSLGGAPLVGTSANLSGQPNPRTVSQVLAAIPRGIRLAIDGGETPAGLPSTLVDTTVSPFRVLRPGAVALETLREVAGDWKIEE